MLETGTSEHRTSGFALTVAHGSALLPKSGALCGRLFDEKSASKGRRSCSWRLVNASQRRGMVDRIGSALIEEGQIDGVDVKLLAVSVAERSLLVDPPIIKEFISMWTLMII